MTEKQEPGVFPYRAYGFKEEANEMLRRYFCDEDGQGMTEYILIIALIAVVCVVAVKLFGAEIQSLISKSVQMIKDQTN